MGRLKFNLTEGNIYYAVDNNCNTSRALASGLYRPLWRRFDSSSARDCRHRARYSAYSRQKRALSESVFAPAVSVVHQSILDPAQSLCFSTTNQIVWWGAYRKVQSRESRVLRLGFEDRRREFQAFSFDPIALFFGTHLELCVIESS